MNKSIKTAISLATAMTALTVTSAQAALIAHWTLDGDTDADAGGWGASTSSATTSFVTDAPTQINTTQSIDFSGTNYKVTTGYGSAAGAQSAITVAFWYKTTGALIGNTPLLTIGEGTGKSAEFTQGGSQKSSVFYQNGNVIGTANSLETDGEWHHVAWSYSITHANAKLYYDGADVTDTIGGTVGNSLNFELDAPLILNGDAGGVGANNFRMADVAVWDKVLTAGVVADLADGSMQVAVPEPSTTALLGLGGLALIFRRRK